MNKKIIFLCGILLILGLTGCGKETSTEKIQITFSTYSPINWNAITMFNENNDTYEVVCVSYLDKADNFEQYEDYLKQLNLQILAGTAPDMFIAVPDFYFSYDNRDFTSYVEKGVLEDLMPYMERDFEDGEYLEAVLYSFEKDGGVYALPYDFRLGLQIANAGRIPCETGWNFREMKAYMEEHPEIEIYSNELNRDALLRELVLYGGIAWNDYETIQECILFAEKYDCEQLPKDERALNTPKALVSEISLAGPMYWFDILTTWGEDACFVGSPRENRQGILQFSTTISMNAASKNKDGVWEFFKFLMSEEYQKTLIYFPVRTEQYEAYWEYYMTEQTENIYDESTDSYIEEPVIRYVTPEHKLVTCLSEEDKRRMEELINRSATFIWETDMNAWQIIEEEAASYYSGQKSIDEVMVILEKRMELYLDERQ